MVQVDVHFYHNKGQEPAKIAKVDYNYKEEVFRSPTDLDWTDNNERTHGLSKVDHFWTEQK